MIDISLSHANRVMQALSSSEAENYGYVEEFDSLDLKKLDHALYAIKKWIASYSKSDIGTEIGWNLRKEAMKFCMTLNIPFGDVSLPGIDIPTSLYKEKGCEYLDYKKNLKIFQSIVWSSIFPEEQFSTFDTLIYRQRTDFGFVFFPDFPGKWGTPEYRPWDMSLQPSS